MKKSINNGNKLNHLFLRLGFIAFVLIISINPIYQFSITNTFIPLFNFEDFAYSFWPPINSQNKDNYFFYSNGFLWSNLMKLNHFLISTNYSFHDLPQVFNKFGLFSFYIILFLNSIIAISASYFLKKNVSIFL